jgi:predicted sulfurtransferase
MDTQASKPFTNISGYLFATLAQERQEELRAAWQQACEQHEVTGTILISPEGINAMLCGPAPGVEAVVATVRSADEFGGIEFKYSASALRAFRRLKVKLKPEIITFRRDGISPAEKPAPKLSAEELKQWYDEGRDFVIIDTRNEFEYHYGTFRGALNPHIRKFYDFPEAVEQMREAIGDRPVVTFCTGGIRCEKAAPWMLENGFARVYQLDGGIIRYFENCGDEHWVGSCFVFDERVALDGDLEEQPTAPPSALAQEIPQ